MRLKVTITLAAAALLGGLTACNNEFDRPQADRVPENAVRITASIHNPFAATRSMPTGTAEEQTKFKAGDEILVYVNDDHTRRAIYRFDGSVWTPKDGKYLLWQEDTEDFCAKYPAEWGSVHISGAPYDYQTDQSTEENIAKADLMSATLNGQAKTKDALHFTMQRWMARFIVKIAGFNSEFPADAKVENVKFHSRRAGASQATYTPYAEGRGEAGSTYTVLVPDNASDHTVSLTVGDKTMTAKLRDYTPDEGKSYTFNLTVGKEKLEPGEVTVADWTGSTVITGGEAEAD